MSLTVHSTKCFPLIAATIVFTVSQLASLHAQEKSGTAATPAVGSEVETMKPDCPPKTASGEEQKQHAPTKALSKEVPTMTASGECPDESTSTKAETQKK